LSVSSRLLSSGSRGLRLGVGLALRNLWFDCCSGRFLVTDLAIVSVVNATSRGRRVLSAKTGVLDQRYHRNFRLVSRSVTDKPRVVFVLADVFTERAHLRRPRLAGNTETSHLDTRGGAAGVH